MIKESHSIASRPGKLFLRSVQVIRDVLHTSEDDGGSFSAWLPPYLVIVSLADQPPMLHVSYYRTLPLNKLTAMYPAHLRRLNVSGTPEPFSIILSSPEAIYRYAVQVWLQTPLAPVDFQKIVSAGRTRSEEGYKKITGS